MTDRQKDIVEGFRGEGLSSCNIVEFIEFSHRTCTEILGTYTEVCVLIVAYHKLYIGHSLHASDNGVHIALQVRK